MFERVIAQTIQRITAETLQERSLIPLVDILQDTRIPARIKPFFETEVHWWLYNDALARAANKRFDYEHPELASLLNYIEQVQFRHARFEREEFITVLDSAVKLIYNYLCRPQTTLKWYIFRGQPVKPLTEVMLRFGAFIDYEYFRNVFTEWVERKRAERPTFDAISATEFERVIRRIDDQILLNCTVEGLLEMMDPLFEFIGEGTDQLIPIDALVIFFDDKNIKKLVDQLENYRERGGESVGREGFVALLDELLSSADDEPEVDFSSVYQNDALDEVMREHLQSGVRTAESSQESYDDAPEEQPQPAPIASQPEPVVSQPEPVVPQPEPVVPQPAPIASQPEPIVPQPEPIAPQPAPAQPVTQEAPAADHAITELPAPTPIASHDQPPHVASPAQEEIPGSIVESAASVVELEHEPVEHASPTREPFDDAGSLDGPAHELPGASALKDALDAISTADDTDMGDDDDEEEAIDDRAPAPMFPGAIDDELIDADLPIETVDEEMAIDEEELFDEGDLSVDWLADDDDIDDEEDDDDDDRAAPHPFVATARPHGVEGLSDADEELAEEAAVEDAFSASPNQHAFANGSAEPHEVASREHAAISTERDALESSLIAEAEELPRAEPVPEPAIEEEDDEEDDDDVTEEMSLPSFNGGALAESIRAVEEPARDVAMSGAASQTSSQAEAPSHPMEDVRRFIDAGLERKVIKKVFQKNRAEYEGALDRINGAATWRTASQILDELFIRYDVDPYSRTAIRFTDSVYGRYLPGNR